VRSGDELLLRATCPDQGWPRRCEVGHDLLVDPDVEVVVAVVCAVRVAPYACWNCCDSVDPASARVDPVGLRAAATASKYPVPTSAWCRTAV